MATFDVFVLSQENMKGKECRAVYLTYELKVYSCPECDVLLTLNKFSVFRYVIVYARSGVIYRYDFTTDSIGTPETDS